MQELREERPSAGQITRRLAQGLAGVAAAVALLLILPSLPYVLLAGMLPNQIEQATLIWTPVLLVVSLVSGTLCMARFGIGRFVLAVVPVTAVIVAWFATH